MSIMDMLGGAPGGQPPAAPGDDVLRSMTGLEGEDEAPTELTVADVQELTNQIQSALAQTQSPEIQAALSKAETALSGLVLALQKEEDAAMGTTPAHKYIARQQGQGGY